jgi:hypothetical protein
MLFASYCSFSIPRQEGLNYDFFETEYGERVYECSLKMSKNNNSVNKQLIPLGKNKVRLIDGSTFSFKADAFIEGNGSVSIYTIMKGNLNDLMNDIQARSPPSTLNPAFKPERASLGVMITEAVADFSFRMMLNTLHGMIRLSGLPDSETTVMAKMINVSTSNRMKFCL